MATQRELLDPERWAEVLKLCANAMQMAVALTSPEGQLLGPCHNPQPIWRLARNSRPEWGAGCPFCLPLSEDPSGQCTAAADTRRTGSVVLAHDHGGFVHVAVPLYLGPEHFGTLMAGQVFGCYPESLAIEGVAREFGLSAQRVWDIAQHQVPFSHSILKVYGSLLHTVGQTLLGQLYGTILESRLATTDAELQSTNQELERANKDLLAKVAELSKSNGEKSVLMQEVHHRVNNNLQVIGSLLRMQVESAEDHRLADALRTSQLRIESMALIHAQLYDAADLQQVDFAEYTARLVDNLGLSYGVDRQRIALSVDMGVLKLMVDQAIPAGLILSELISNAIKYGFPDQRHGSIRVEGGRHGDRVEFAVRDDGVGLPEPSPAPAQGRKSRGLQIVTILCGQLHGTLEQTQAGREPGPGALFRISFRDKSFPSGSSAIA